MFYSKQHGRGVEGKPETKRKETGIFNIGHDLMDRSLQEEL